jgi:hypothetical protein
MHTCMSNTTPACTRACAKRVFGAAFGSELQTQMQAQAKQHLAASAPDQAHTRRVAKDGSRGKERGRVVGTGADSATLAKKKMGRSLRTGAGKKTHVSAAHDTSTRKVKAMRTRAASRGNALSLFFPESVRKPSAHVCARAGASVSLEAAVRRDAWGGGGSASFSSASDESTPRRIRQISTYACMLYLFAHGVSCIHAFFARSVVPFLSHPSPPSSIARRQLHGSFSFRPLLSLVCSLCVRRRFPPLCHKRAYVLKI